MITVFCRGLTAEARKSITTVFGYKKIPPEYLQLIDLDFYDLDVSKHKFIFCIGVAIKDVVKDLVARQYYTSADTLHLYRFDTVDESDGGFLLFTCNVPPEHWMTGAREDQIAAFKKVETFTDNFKRLYRPPTEAEPFNDRLPNLEQKQEVAPEPEPEQVIAELDQKLVEPEVIPDVQDEAAEVRQVEKDIIQMATVAHEIKGWDLDKTISVDVGMFMTKLGEMINLSDLGNSKTFASYPAFVLHTSGEDLHVFGTTSDLNKSKAKMKILLKDLCALLKAAHTFNAGKISFCLASKVEV